MTFTISQTLPSDEWRHFVAQTPHGNIFHTPEMFQVFERTKGHTPTLWAARDAAGNVQALLLPVQITLKSGLMRRLTSRAVAYGSVLCAPGPPGQQALAALLPAYKQAVKGQVLFTELRNLSDLSDLQPVLQANGFDYEDHLNFLIDLDRPLKEVMQSIGSRTRKNIRRGLRRAEVTIEEIEQPAQLAEWYRLLTKTYKQAGVPLADASLFKAAFDLLYPRGMVKFLLAQVGDDCAAGSVELVFKDVIYGWYGGLDREYGRYMPNEMLIWHIFEWGVENDCRMYDFGGAGKPDEDYGVRDFKAKFGGELVCYGRNVCVHAPTLMRLSTWGYRLLRRWL